ncbi:MAG: hypothetical protein K6G07_08665, partial [Lachnospiraceae bacterium]|nr:hypothetical protein [Lachnospiraceae bacterium]
GWASSTLTSASYYSPAIILALATVLYLISEKGKVAKVFGGAVIISFKCTGIFFDGGIKAKKWLEDGTRFLPDHTSSYLIMSASDNVAYAFTAKTQFGDCVDYFTVGDYYIYIWNYDIAERLLP